MSAGMSNCTQLEEAHVAKGATKGRALGSAGSDVEEAAAAHQEGPLLQAQGAASSRVRRRCGPGRRIGGAAGNAAGWQWVGLH